MELTTRYEQGQVWQYNSRPEDENSVLIVVATEAHEKYGVIVSVTVVGLQMRSTHHEKGYIEHVSHLPLAEKALDESVTECLGYADELPPFEEGYNAWKEAFDAGNAGIFTIPVAEVVQAMEAAMNA
jgi:hypothetical protein